LGFDFLKPARSGRVVLEVSGLDLAAGDKPLLHDVSFALERGEHVALVGPNGSGKTTLLETVLGRRDPQRGTARLGYGVEAAYFSQHEVELDEHATRLGSPSDRRRAQAAAPREHRRPATGTYSVLECAQGATGLSRPQAQALLGRFLFSGWEAHEKPVAALSGGERRRLALALVVASGANFLVLDEPTNHLDLESREALETALEAFPGTVLLVSHDRALLDAVAERTLALEHGRIRAYDGGWADYVRRREELASTPTAQEPRPEPPKREKKPRPEPRRRETELERLEAEIARREQQVADLERELADDWADVDRVAAYRRARDELDGLLQRWETLFERTHPDAPEAASRQAR
jgi:ATP-binding cassette subfamily F protein 3